VITKGNHLTLRDRLLGAAWVGWAGGMLWGLTEAWAILAHNAAAGTQARIGLLAAMGFVVALDGALGAIGLSLVGLISAQIEKVRRHFNDSSTWTSLCAALFVAALTLISGLDQFGVFSETVAGVRAAIIALNLLTSVVIGAVAFWLARNAITSLHDNTARMIRRAIVVAWIVAALLPIAFALIRSLLA